jgi:multicomponent Na+:H+ antiporter subunit E
MAARPPTRSSASQRLIAVVHRAALFGGLWAVLVRLDPLGLAVGGVIVPLAVSASLRSIPVRSPLDLWRLARHLPRFVAGSIAGGVDVARRAFAPAMPLDPDWLRVKTSLSDGARTALGAEISLMPGTLAAGAEEDYLLVHVLARKGNAESEIAALEAEIAALIAPES